jgi:DNA-binding CsgD family transcriptional regulator
MRIAPPLVIDVTTRREQEQLSRKRSMAALAVLRSRIVLLAGEGMQYKLIARQLGISTRMAAWSRRILPIPAMPCAKNRSRLQEAINSATGIRSAICLF